MNNFEQFPRGEEFLAETGSRPGINQEVGSHFGETYDAMLDKLEANGDGPLHDFITALPDDRKDKLGLALNGTGRDWMFLTRFGKENSQAVKDAISTWNEVVETAADTQAIRNANRSLGDSLDEI